MADRFKRRQEDVNIILNACKTPGCPFRNVFSQESLISFEISEQIKSAKKFYRITLSEDYPDHSVVSKSLTPTAQFDSEISSSRLPVILTQIAKDVGSRWTCPSASSGNHSNHGVTMERLSSNEFSDCNSDEYLSDDNYEDEDYYGDQMDGVTDEEVTFNAAMEEDMQALKEVYGDNSLTHRVFSSIDDVDVELNIPMRFLDAEIAKAWRVKATEPLIIRIHMSVSRYLDGTEPKVEVFQPSQKEKFGVGSQMKKIMENFIKMRWKDITNEYVRKVHENSLGHSNPKKKLHTQTSNIETSSSPGQSTGPPPGQGPGQAGRVEDGAVARLVEMGFSPEMARNSLLITRNNVDEALNLLLSSPESCTGMVVDSGKSPAPKPAPPPRPTRQNSRGNKKKPPSRGWSWGSSPGGATAAPELDGFLNLTSSSLHGKNAKQVPGFERGFLVQVMRYALQRVPTLNEFCVVCDEPHVFQNGAMLKPAVCARDLCVFSFQTLGVMSDAADDIATGAEVVDLLICMANAACKSHRKEIIFDPFPTIVDPQNPHELALCDSKKNFSRAERALDSLLSMREMTQLIGPELKKSLDRRDILSYPLLQWIISSNRSHVVKLPPERQIPSMNTPHQFLLMSSPPAKEAIFREEKKKYGSTFAFHGSHIENWHSIMRVGLINASGTKHQMHGSAYGKGIYLSPHATVSSGYSGMSQTVYGRPQHVQTGKKQHSVGTGVAKAKGKDRFLHSKNLRCIALCEVITSKDLRKNNQIWVMPNPDHVCTRFFFVYEDGQTGDSGVDTQVQKYKQEINLAVNYKYHE